MDGVLSPTGTEVYRDLLAHPATDLYSTHPDEDGLNLLVNFHAGQRRAWESTARFVAVLAGTQSGKALALDTPIPTPGGFVEMGDLRDGDTVFDETGVECRVIKAHERYHPWVCYRVTFDDGSSVIADAQHRWVVVIGGCRFTSTTETLRGGGGEYGLPATDRKIVGVEPTPPTVVRCITVDSPSSLYQCGTARVPTHNTSWGPWWLWREIYGDGTPRSLGGKGGGDYIAATANYDLFKLKMLPAIREVFETLFGLGRYWRQARIMELRPDRDTPFQAQRVDDPMWGRIILRSAEAPGGLESSTAKAAWLDEAGQDSFRVETWEAVLSRLALSEGRCLLSSTLFNFGWLKTACYDRWKAGDPDYDVVHFDSILNPRFSRKEWDRARASMPAWKFAMRYQGRYEKPAGMIYDCFRDSYSPDGHLVRPFEIPWTWPRHLGLDFGGVHTAGAFLAEDPAAKLFYWYRQYLAGDLTAADHVAALRAGEPPDIHAVGGSWSEGQWRDEFRAGGLYVERPDVSEVEIGISRLYGALKTHRLLVFDDLVGGFDDPMGGTLGELRSYARKLDHLGEPTEVILNKSAYHRADAARYICANVFAPLATTPSMRAGRNPLSGFSGRRAGRTNR